MSMYVCTYVCMYGYLQYVRRLLGVWGKEKSLDPKDQERAEGFTYAAPTRTYAVTPTEHKPP